MGNDCVLFIIIECTLYFSYEDEDDEDEDYNEDDIYIMMQCLFVCL